MTRDDDLQREIRAHLDLDAEERVAEGASPQEARDAAQRAFGNVTRIRENAREVWVAPAFDHLVQDLRYAARCLRRAPAFAITAILVLAAGIGLNLTFFQILNVAAIRPLNVAGIDTLVRLDRVTKHFSSNGIPYPATQFVRANNTAFRAVLTSSGGDVVWEDDASDRLNAVYVSANWFDELGYGAAIGRPFAEAIDERPDAPPVVMVSYDFWQSRLGGESVVGRTVRVNGRPTTIAGVAPAGFPGLRLNETQIWLPIHQMGYFNPGSTFEADWGAHNTQLYGRLRGGVSPAMARERLQSTLTELARIRPKEFDADESLVPAPGREGFRNARDNAKLRTMTLFMTGLMLTVLVLACANLNGILFSRAIARIRELSVRAALGASRWRILRQQLLESTLLVLLGTGGGLLASMWGARALAAQIEMPRHVDLTPDRTIVLAATAIAFVATLAVGIVPAWIISRRDLIGAMKDGGQQTSQSLTRARFRLVLVACQVAACCILLVVAGSTVRAVRHLVGSHLGFEFAHVAVLDPTLSRYGVGGAAAAAFWHDVKARLEREPEIVRVALASHPPFGQSAGRSIFNDAPRLVVTGARVDSSFFPLLRIPILAGRSFAAKDEGAGVVIVSRRLAMQMYGRLDVVGRGFPRSNPNQEIVGVAGDAPLVHVTATNVAELYWPVGRSDYGGVVLLTEARTRPERLLTPLRDAVRAADPRILPRTFVPSAQFEQRVQSRRVASLSAGFLGALALLLACVGIFGLVASGAGVRTREIGIRRALGARGGSLVGLLLRQLAIPLAIGMLLGTAGGLSASRVLADEPFYLPAIDVATLVTALGVFVTTAGFAAVLPAVRALRADPLQALRHE